MRWLSGEGVPSVLFSLLSPNNSTQSVHPRKQSCRLRGRGETAYKAMCLADVLLYEVPLPMGPLECLGVTSSTRRGTSPKARLDERTSSLFAQLPLEHLKRELG